MQQISRIYLANCGFPMAWYDGVMLELIDPQTGLPTDTIINLENGGGKTSLLSLIFSCFDTAQDRFLKHLQSKNNHFSQYFSSDGLLGYILVEWHMPSKTAGGKPYRLIIGQVVCVRAGTDLHECERMFFSFEATDEWTLESVPAPKLGAQAISSWADFSRWIHEAQKQYADIFCVRKQNDWQRHLKERLIDLELLQMQVNFSMQEGGFDTGFLNFNSEIGFLQKFFHLTLDGERAMAVRDAVTKACDKLRRKPHFQSKLDELTKFSAKLAVFASNAYTYRAAFLEQCKQKFEGSRLVLAMKARAAERWAKQKLEEAYVVEQQAVARSTATLAADYAAQAVSISTLILRRNIEDAKEHEIRAESALNELNKDIRLVKAAHAWAAVKMQEERLDDLEAQAVLAQEGLRPFRTHADTQGALLRSALTSREQTLHDVVKRLDSEAVERQESIKTHRQTHTELMRKETELRSKRERLLTYEEAYSREVQRHVNAARLLSASELGESAITRWEIQRVQWLAEETGHNAEQHRHELAAQEWAAQQTKAATEQTRIEGEITQVDKLLAEGSALREALSELEIAQLAIESDIVDPDSPVLVPALDQLAKSSGVAASLANARLAELRSTEQAILETGVAGRSADVAAVVARLRDAGIQSARAFNEYLASAVPEAMAARALVLSDPARFLGVAVSPTELDKARRVNWESQQLARPVVISPIALESQPMSGHIVVPASSDAAYNKGAAAVYAASIKQSIGAEQENSANFTNRQREAISAIQCLNDYRKRFGDGKLTTFAAKRMQLLAEKELAAANLTMAKTEAENEKSAANQCRDLANARASNAKDGASHIEELQHFVHVHECGRQCRLEEIVELAEILEELLERRDGEQSEIERLNALALAESTLRTNSARDADGYKAERNAIELYDEALSADEILREKPRDIDFLRSAYRDAKAAHDTKASDQLGVLEHQLKEARQQRNQKQAEYKYQFGDVVPQEFQCYLGRDHALLLGERESQVPSLTTESTSAKASRMAAESAYKDWQKKNSKAAPVTPDLETLPLEMLDQEFEKVQALSEAASRYALLANQEAERASQQAKYLGDTAVNDERWVSALEAAMKLDEVPNLTLLALETNSLAGYKAIDMDQLPMLVLEDSPDEQLKRLLQAQKAKLDAYERAQGSARNAFDAVKAAAAEPKLKEVEPELATAMLTNEFQAACTDATRLQESLRDRIQTTQDNLDKMQTDFDQCVDEMQALVRVAINLLNSAVEKRVPHTAPYVGGKPVLKLRTSFAAMNVEARREVLRHYLDSLIQNNVVPVKGSDLVAESILRMSGGRPLGLNVLRMVIDESQQYVPVDKISNSGGEGVVMALFLYVVIAQLRAETQARLHKLAGGPLILDNPFAKATSPTMWKAQRALAQSMGVQLIFATAIQDYNALAEFSSFVRLRRAGQNSKTNRYHIERVQFRLNEPPFVSEPNEAVT